MINCGDQKQYIVYYKKYPLSFLSLDPVGTQVLNDPGNTVAYPATLVGTKGCKCKF